MNSKLARAVALIAGLHILGGHWLLLQMAAWIGMFAVHTQDSSLSVAVSNTFDGKSPCALCEAVSSGQEEEREHQTFDVNFKVEAVLAVKVSLPPLKREDRVYFSHGWKPGDIRFKPHSPPPRLA